MVKLIRRAVSESRSVVSDALWPHRLYSLWNSSGQNTGVGSCSLLQGIFPTQGSNPGLPHCRWILYQLSHQGSPRILEWVAYPFSSRSSRPRGLPHCRQILYQLSYQGSLRWGQSGWENLAGCSTCWLRQHSGAIQRGRIDYKMKLRK